MTIYLDRFECHFVDVTNEPDISDWPVTALNQTLLTDLENAVRGVTLNTFVASIRVDRTQHTVGSTTPPADPFARNENRWSIRVRDTITGLSDRLYIAGLDASLLLPNSDEMDTGVGTPGADLVTAIEAIVSSRNGNPVEVVKIEIAD